MSGLNVNGSIIASIVPLLVTLSARIVFPGTVSLSKFKTICVSSVGFTLAVATISLPSAFDNLTVLNPALNLPGY